MDYGKLLQRAWQIVTQNPYLVLFGVIVAVMSGGPSSGTSYTSSGESSGQFLSDMGLDRFEPWMGVAITAIVGLICLGIIIALVLWLLQQVARGGLIAGVDGIEQGATTSFSTSWRAGWHRKWTLVGIGLVVAIPVILLVLLGVGGLFVFFGAAMVNLDWLSPAVLFSGGMIGFLGLLCVLLPVILFIGMLSEFAYRAAMLEGAGVWESYRRGWHVLFDNIGPVIVLVAIRIGIGIVLLLPLVISSLCCLLWPVLVVLQGAVATYFSTVWTLAWREFTGVLPSAPDGESLEPA
jgi:hypothetical protein